MSVHSFLLVLCVIYPIRGQVVTPNGCFEAIRGCRIGGIGAPYAVTTAATQADCLAQCQADTRCAGVRFAAGFNGAAGTCRLYNVFPGTRYPYVPYFRPNNGGFNGRFGGPNNGFNGRYNGGRYNGGGGRGGFGGFDGRFGGGGRGRGRFDDFDDGPGGFRGRGGGGGNYGGGFFRSMPQKQANLGDPANNTILAKFLKKASRPDGKVVKGDGGEMIFPKEAAPVKGSPLSEQDIRNVIENSKKENKTAELSSPMARHHRHQPYFYYGGGRQLFRWTGTCPRTGGTVATVPPAVTVTVATTPRQRPTTPQTQPPTPPLPAKVRCPPGQVAKYLKLENTELAGLDDYTFTAASVDECIQACTNNALPDGSQAPCASFDYDRTTSTCALSLEAIPPAGSGTTAEAPGKDYYEKVCLDATLVEGCTDVLETLPNTILVGFARQVTTETSYAACIQTCLNSQQLFGFKCISGQYFYDVPDGQNCVLNEESKNTQPGLINVVPNERVNYFDFDCQQRRSPLGEPIKMGQAGNIIKPGREEWGPWSYCDRRTNTVTRYRNCLSHNPRSCENETTSCDKKN